MSKATGINRFAFVQNAIDIKRSRFDRSWGHTTTLKSGDLVPIFLDSVLPGDTVKIDYSMVTRMLSPVAPTFGNLFFDIYFFFVPYRLIAGDSSDPKLWQKIEGENTSGYWAPSEESVLPTATFYHCLAGSIANYFGLPCINKGADIALLENTAEINVLPFKAYTLIWNEFFRDQNVEAPLDINSYAITADDTTLEIDGRVTYNNDGYVNYGNPEATLKVAKLHDYFTSALPAPQKGDSVSLPLGKDVPVITKSATIPASLRSNNSLYWYDTGSGHADYADIGSLVTDGGETLGVDEGQIPQGDFTALAPANLYADLSNATAATINNLRQAFAIQRVLEKDARSGSRYREFIKSHFNVILPDFTAQVPEYLGGKRVPINVTQVLQTSNNTSAFPNSPINHVGHVGAFSNTADSDHVVTKSFNEYGLVMGLCCVRNMQQYTQGIAKDWFKTRRFDFYLPGLANLGEQPVLNKELYFDFFSELEHNDEVFGYQEAWAEYRYHPSMVTGYLAPGANDLTLTAWTYSNNFASRPTLGKEFIEQSSSNVANTLFDPQTETQFILDTWFTCDYVRPMPVNSIPGGLDGRW